jgi:hypothetical protein
MNQDKKPAPAHVSRVNATLLLESFALASPKLSARTTHSEAQLLQAQIQLPIGCRVDWITRAMHIVEATQLGALKKYTSIAGESN